MNDDLQKALLAILKDSTDSIKSGMSFLQQQIPDVILQLLHWHFAYNLTLFLIWFIVGIIFFIIAFCNRETWFDDPRFFVSIVGALLAWLVSITCGLIAMQIYIAPKIFLIEYAANLVRCHQ